MFALPTLIGFVAGGMLSIIFSILFRATYPDVDYFSQVVLSVAMSSLVILTFALIYFKVATTPTTQPDFEAGFIPYHTITGKYYVNAIGSTKYDAMLNLEAIDVEANMFDNVVMYPVEIRISRDA